MRKDKPSSGLLKKLEVLRPVLTGNAQAVKLPARQRRDFKDAGFTTTRGYTIISKAPYETVKVSKEGLPELKTTKVERGAPFLRRIILPANVRRMDTFEKFLRDEPERFAALAPEGALFGFTYYGNRSRNIVPLNRLYEYLLKYNAIFEDEGRFEQLILYAMDYSNARRWYAERERTEKQQSEWRGPNAPLDEEGKANRRQREAARMRAYRKRKREEGPKI